MKKIELNTALKFVLIILTWLLTFTVVNLSATLNNSGSGLIGTLVIYAGLLFLAFSYFNDADLQCNVKYSLLVIVICAIGNLFVSCYGYAIQYFDITNETALKIGQYITGIYNILKNITLGVFLILALLSKFNATKENNETKEIEAKEETKEETKE